MENLEPGDTAPHSSPLTDRMTERFTARIDLLNKGTMSTSDFVQFVDVTFRDLLALIGALEQTIAELEEPRD